MLMFTIIAILLTHDAAVNFSQVGIFSSDIPGTLEDLDALMMLPMTPHPCSAYS